jgi:enoyl-[acyl-carrier protein] reductase I
LRRHRHGRPSTPSSTGSKERWGKLDFVVHAIAFSDKEELRRPLCRHHRRQFPAMTMDISAYSLTAVCQRAEKLMGRRRLAC